MLTPLTQIARIGQYQGFQSVHKIDITLVCFDEKSPNMLNQCSEESEVFLCIHSWQGHNFKFQFTVRKLSSQVGPDSPTEWNKARNWESHTVRFLSCWTLASRSSRAPTNQNFAVCRVSTHLIDCMYLSIVWFCFTRAICISVVTKRPPVKMQWERNQDLTFEEVYRLLVLLVSQWRSEMSSGYFVVLFYNLLCQLRVVIGIPHWALKRQD